MSAKRICLCLLGASSPDLPSWLLNLITPCPPVSRRSGESCVRGYLTGLSTPKQALIESFTCDGQSSLQDNTLCRQRAALGRCLVCNSTANNGRIEFNYNSLRLAIVQP